MDERPAQQQRLDARQTLFRQPWWLDAVAGEGGWDRRKVQLNNGDSLDWVFVLKRVYGFTVLTSPQLSPYLGPLFEIDTPSGTRRLSAEKKLYNGMLEELPPHDAFNQRFHPAVTNWAPLYWQGFQQRTLYLHRLHTLDADRAWAGLMQNIRGDIRKSRDRLGLSVGEIDIDTFLDINAMSFDRQGISLPYSRDLVKRIDVACAARNCRAILGAHDREGRLHAAAYLVWDDRSAYYLMGGGDTGLRSSGATSLVLWEAIRQASEVASTFDFLGSMLEPVERFVRAFGGVQTPYSHVWKFNSRIIKLGWNLKQGLS